VSSADKRFVVRCSLSHTLSALEVMPEAGSVLTK
jgi:hypothetical protein